MADLYAEYREATKAISESEANEILWKIIADITSSYSLALEGAGSNSDFIDSIHTEVIDYLANNYGED